MHIAITRWSKKWRRFGMHALFGAAFALNCAAASAAGPYAYVPSNYHDFVSVVDLSSGALTQFQDLANGTGNPGFWGVALSQPTGMLYISGYDRGVVYRVSTANGQVLNRYQVNGHPRGIAVGPSGRYVYAVDADNSSLLVIDTTTGTIKSVDFSLSGRMSLTGIALNLAGTRAYVTDSSLDHRLCRINLVSLPDEVMDADCVTVGASDNAQPTGVAVSPDGSRAYVAIHGTGSSVVAVDTRNMTALREISLGYAGPNGIAVSASGKRAYVSTSNAKVVSLDLTKVDDPSADPVLHVVNTLNSSVGVSISPDGTRLLVVDQSKLHFVNIVGDADIIVSSVSLPDNGGYALGQFTPVDSIFVSGFE